MSEGAPDGVGLGEAEVALDPFTPRLAFAARFGASIRTWFDRCRVEGITPIDTGVDRRIDLDAIVSHSAWVGSVKAPRPKTQEEYPLELEEQLREVERQFILRNLARYELDIDPDEPMPLDRHNIERPSIEGVLDASRYAYEPPELLEETLLDAVKSEMAWRREFTRTMRWERHFGSEVKKHYSGPLWKYDPDTAEAARAKADAAAAGDRDGADDDGGTEPAGEAG